MNIRILRALLVAAGVSACVMVMPAAAQTVRTVSAGGDLQAAINAAQPGDTIALAPGATYVGNFTLPAKSGSAYITIRSATPDSALPGEGERIHPRHAGMLAKIRSSNGAAALATAPGAHHYRLLFLEFLANTAGAGDIIKLGDGSWRQNSIATVPHDIIVDRVYIHGDRSVGQKRGISLNSASTRIVNSYISEIKAAGMDSQAICGWNGPGPFHIENNYLEAAGENVMFGGGDPAIANLVPTDITFTRNHLSKPLAWRGTAWTVKNLFELKSARRVRVDNNLFEYNWVAAQTGSAILLKSVNQDGGAPWSVVEHVEFTNNVVRHVSSAISILGRDTRYPAQELNNVTFRNNLFADVSASEYGGVGRFALIQGGAHITFDHNTAINDGAVTLFADGPPVSGFVFTNNVMLNNGYAIKGSGTAPGNGTLGHYFPGAYVVGNVIAGGNSDGYPSGNYYPAIEATGFVNFAGGNYQLAPTSAYAHAATDGRAPGCNFATLSEIVGPPPLGPDVPQGLVATVNGSTVTLQWSAPRGAVLGYLLEAGFAPGAANAAQMITTDTSLVVAGVPAGTYYVRVRAGNHEGIGPASNEVVVNVGGQCVGVPQAPSDLQASTQHLTASVAWDAPAGGCAPTHYVLLAGSASGLSNLAHAAIVGNVLHASAAPGTYYVRVVAVNAQGVSAPSNEIIVTLTP